MVRSLEKHRGRLVHCYRLFWEFSLLHWMRHTIRFRKFILQDAVLYNLVRNMSARSFAKGQLEDMTNLSFRQGKAMKILPGPAATFGVNSSFVTGVPSTVYEMDNSSRQKPHGLDVVPGEIHNRMRFRSDKAIDLQKQHTFRTNWRRPVPWPRKSFPSAEIEENVEHGL
jgi:hypothetical protein